MTVRVVIGVGVSVGGLGGRGGGRGSVVVVEDVSSGIGGGDVRIGGGKGVVEGRHSRKKGVVWGGRWVLEEGRAKGREERTRGEVERKEQMGRGDVERDP